MIHPAASAEISRRFLHAISVLTFLLTLSSVTFAVEKETPPADSITPDSAAGETFQMEVDTLPRQNPEEPADSTITGSLASPVIDSSDTVAVSDTLQNDSTIHRAGTGSHRKTEEDTTTVKEGYYFSAGFGWSLGGVKVMDLWQHALPDSLGSFLLSTNSYSAPFDSTGPESQSVDTARLAFSVKEHPAPYSMSFPLSISLITIRENGFHSFSLQGSWMRKVFSATISAPLDSLDRKVDYIETINYYSLFASFTYGVDIPEYYFNVESIERTSFTFGCDLSPLLVTMINRKVTAPAGDDRFIAIKNRIDSPRHRYLHGTATAARIGLSMIKRMDRKNALQYGIWYSLQWNGYFKEDGDRVGFNDIAPGYRKKDTPLSWFSSRFELTIAILHRMKKK